MGRWFVFVVRVPSVLRVRRFAALPGFRWPTVPPVASGFRAADCKIKINYRGRDPLHDTSTAVGLRGLMLATSRSAPRMGLVLFAAYLRSQVKISLNTSSLGTCQPS